MNCLLRADITLRLILHRFIRAGVTRIEGRKGFWTGWCCYISKEHKSEKNNRKIKSNKNLKVPNIKKIRSKLLWTE